MTAGDGSAGNEFGRTLAATSEVVVVGAPNAHVASINGDGGAVYVFDANSGAQLARLLAPSPSWGGDFGYSVDIAGDMIVVGATGGDNYRGLAHIFHQASKWVG